jgi:D-alanine-D-alanine ligase
MKWRKVGVLMGGISSERDVSLMTGEAVAEALDILGYDAQRIVVGRDVDRVLRDLDIDVAFLALHGRYGEDGCIQGLLELLGIPYTGSGVLASALAMDKIKAKEIFRLHNIPTPPYYVVDAESAGWLADLHGSFGFPVVVKPRSEGSGVGVGVVRRMEDLLDAVERALVWDDKVLVERWVEGREVVAGLLDGRVLGAMEVEPAEDTYGFTLEPGLGTGAECHLPARLPPTRYRCVLTLAERANRVLGCVGASRVDLVVTEGENEYVLEVDSLPVLTPESLLSRVAAGSGYDFPRLVESVLECARLHSSDALRTQIVHEGDAGEEEPAEVVSVPVLKLAGSGR